MQFHIKNILYNHLKKRKRNKNRYLRSCSSWLHHLFLFAVLWVVDKSWSRSLRFLICDKLLLTALQQYKQRLICCRSNKFLWIREESSLGRFTPSLALVLFSFSLLTSPRCFCPKSYIRTFERRKSKTTGTFPKVRIRVLCHQKRAVKVSERGNTLFNLSCIVKKMLKNLPLKQNIFLSPTFN